MKIYNKNILQVPEDLLAAQRFAYEPSGISCKNVVREAESQEYSACTFEINYKVIKFRVGKIAPTKIGQFITFWKRIGSGPIVPYDMSDAIDFFVVSVRKDEKCGQFVFPKEILWEKGYISKEGVGGKRAIRVYPPWDTTESDQAQRTQAWQLLYYFEIQPNPDICTILKLFWVTSHQR